MTGNETWTWGKISNKFFFFFFFFTKLTKSNETEQYRTIGPEIEGFWSNRRSFYQTCPLIWRYFVFPDNVKLLWLGQFSHYHTHWSTHWSWRVHISLACVTWPWPHLHCLLAFYMCVEFSWLGQFPYYMYNINVQPRLTILGPHFDHGTCRYMSVIHTGSP